MTRWSRGAGLNNRETVEFVVSEAPAAIERLADLGVPFNGGEEFGERWHLTREGGHSHRRIVHVDDATGHAVQVALLKAARANPNITLMEDMVAIDLITSRHGERYFGRRPCRGVLRLQQADQTRRRPARPRDHPLPPARAGRTYLFSTAAPARPATASPWPGARAAAYRTWK
ncbi:FAD-binding protein [Sphingobium rhizovicinum]|uniref:FAD-binding protein n=1 Tax=Sphingobium rhizovicinum TaxID=432308 RepID=A0ABV7NQ36_9SPHN